MKKIITAIGLILSCACAFGANPSFQSFDQAQFYTNFYMVKSLGPFTPQHLSREPYRAWLSVASVGTPSGGLANTCLLAAVAMRTNNLMNFGWDSIHIETGWYSNGISASGHIIIDTANIPMGMQELVRQLHTNGIKEVWLYADDFTGAGITMLTNQAYYSNAVADFKTWGIDGFKWDNRNLIGEDYARWDFQTWGFWIRTIAPEIQFEPYGSSLTNFDWVTETPSQKGSLWGTMPFATMAKYPDWRINLGSVLPPALDYGATNDAFEDIAFFPEHHYNLRQYIYPGHYIFLGGFSENGVWPARNATAVMQMSMWCLWHSPLGISANPLTMGIYSGTMNLLTNRALLDIQRDPLKAYPTRYWTNGAGGEVWGEPLANGDQAVLFLNRNTGSAFTAAYLLSYAGIPTNKAAYVTDLVNGGVTMVTNTLSVSVPAQASSFYRISPFHDIINKNGLAVEYREVTTIGAQQNVPDVWTNYPPSNSALPDPNFNSVVMASSTAGDRFTRHSVPPWVTNCTMTFTVWCSGNAAYTNTTSSYAWADGTGGRLSGAANGTAFVYAPSNGIATFSIGCYWTPAQAGMAKEVLMTWGQSSNTTARRAILSSYKLEYQ